MKRRLCLMQLMRSGIPRLRLLGRVHSLQRVECKLFVQRFTCSHFNFAILWRDRMAARRVSIKRKAAALDAAEAQRRFQMETLGEDAQAAEGPNQDRFVEQLTGRVSAPSFARLICAAGSLGLCLKHHVSHPCCCACVSTPHHPPTISCDRHAWSGLFGMLHTEEHLLDLELAGAKTCMLAFCWTATCLELYFG